MSQEMRTLRNLSSLFVMCAFVVLASGGSVAHAAKPSIAVSGSSGAFAPGQSVRIDVTTGEDVPEGASLFVVVSVRGMLFFAPSFGVEATPFQQSALPERTYPVLEAPAAFLMPTTYVVYAVYATSTLSLLGEVAAESFTVVDSAQESSASIAAGETKSGRLEAGDETMPNGSYYDTWSFTASGGQTISVSVSSDDMSPFVGVFSDDEVADGNHFREECGTSGIAWVEDDLSTPGRMSGTYRIEESGTYVVVIEHLADENVSGVEGSYSVSLMQQ